jgi:hypothetical protein
MEISIKLSTFVRYKSSSNFHHWRSHGSETINHTIFVLCITQCQRRIQVGRQMGHCPLKFDFFRIVYLFLNSIVTMFFLSSESHSSESTEAQCNRIVSQFSSGYPKRYSATSMSQDLGRVPC